MLKVRLYLADSKLELTKSHRGVTPNHEGEEVTGGMQRQDGPCHSNIGKCLAKDSRKAHTVQLDLGICTAGVVQFNRDVEVNVIPAQFGASSIRK